VRHDLRRGRTQIAYWLPRPGTYRPCRALALVVGAAVGHWLRKYADIVL
jgi:hypothetical protein